MKIVYDDLTEFAEVRLRCEQTRNKSMCKYCPFYDRCQIDDSENLHTMCCDILSMQTAVTSDKRRHEGIITKEQAIDILEKFEFFQGRRAGRELWNDKPEGIKDKDVENFSRDCRLLIEYVKDGGQE